MENDQSKKQEEGSFMGKGNMGGEKIAQRERKIAISLLVAVFEMDEEVYDEKIQI